MSSPQSESSTEMRDSIDIDITPRRKLEFGSHEEDKEKELFDNVSGEKLIIERHSTILEEKIPKIGMEFDNEEVAYNFYNEYAMIAGFGIRKHNVHRDTNGRITDRTFCCACQGYRQKDKRDMSVKSHRPETRTGCCAMMRINGRYTGRYKVVNFIAEHNGHDLVSPTKTHMLRSHRNITIVHASQANDIDSSGIAPRAGFALMAKQVGGRENLGFVFEDYKNYLRSKRTIEMKVGDTGGVLEYLQRKQLDDPNFFYAIQVDDDDCIANIVWADAQMMVDYAHFGDVVCFDTTYRKNKEGRPFALFVGVNHHKQTIVFGAALLYDETTSTFIWLFDTFAKAMSGKLPQTILTDQDAAMAKALALKWPETYHRLCIWHIYQNAAIHLSSVFACFPNFLKDFSSCIYDYEEEEEFLTGWQEMLEKYGLQSNEWLGRLFKIREKWALVYGRQSFCADLTTTQRSESMNGVLKRYVSYKHNLLQFFHHFDRLIDDRRYQELKADLRTSHSTPVASFPVQILKHAASVYTHEVFELFQNELRKAYDSKIELYGEMGETFEYKVTPFGKHYQHKVTYDSSQDKVSCSCKKFEFAGILCSHALKVLSSRNILKIPELYIKKRWTKKAKKSIIEAEPLEVGIGSFESVNENEEKQLIGAHYKELCSLNNQLATRAALTVETFRIAKNGLLKMIEEVDASLENITIVNPSRAVEKPISTSKVCEKQAFISRLEEQQRVGASYGTEKALDEDECIPNGIMIKGWKKKEKKPVKSGKRPRSGLEKSIRKRKQKQNNVSSSNNAIVLIENTNQMQNFDNGTNSPSTGNSTQSNPLASLSQLSQEYQVGLSNLNKVYPTEGASLSHVEPFQFTQVFNPTVNQEFNFDPWYSGRDKQSETSLTQLLQQQLLKSREFEGLHLNNSISKGQHKKDNSKLSDVPEE